MLKNKNSTNLKRIELQINYPNLATFYIAENLLPLESIVFVNGTKLKYVHDYYLTNNSITFTNIDKGLNIDDVVEIYYMN